jgi:hypothetical protein
MTEGNKFNAPFSEALKNFKPAVNEAEQTKQRDPKIIEMFGRRVMDIINEEGALIEPDGVVFIDLKGGKREDVFTKKFEDVEGATSHGYMGCAEIIGLLSNGKRFYLHCRGPHSLDEFMKKILSMEDDKEVVVENIGIRGEFGINAPSGQDKKHYSEYEMRRYNKICENLGLEDESIEIKDERIVGFTREKVVGQSWTKDRD